MKTQAKHTLLSSSVSIFQQWLNHPPFGALAFFLVIFLAVSGFKPQTTTINSKVGVVDLERVFVLSRAGKALQQKLEAFQKSVQEEGERLTNEAKAIRQKAVDGANLLSEDKLAELQKQYEDKSIAIRRFQEEKQREGEKMKNEGLRKIELQLEPLIRQLVAQEGVDLLLNNVPGSVIWASQNIDLTDKMVAMMDK